MPLNRTTKVILTAVLAAIVAWLGTSRGFCDSALVSAFFALTLAAVIVIHLRVHPTLLDAGSIFAGMLLFAALDFRVLHWKPAIMAWFSFAGLTSLLVLGVRTIWAQESDRKLLRLAFVPAVFFVLSEYFADTFLHWTSAAHPRVFDLYLFSFDSSLRVQIAFLVGQAFSRWPALYVTGILFYIGLALPIGLIYAGRLLRMKEKAIPSFVAFLITGPAGVIFYNLLPALGPVHLFGRMFPWQPLTTAQASHLQIQPIALTGPPNAIPSLHMAWVLLVWWYSRGLSWWERAVAFLFLAFTVLATMGTGEHYFVDLVVAFPFALLIEGLFAFSIRFADRRRILATAAGLCGTLAWLEALRFALPLFWSSPAIPWICCVVTVVGMLWLESRLLHAQEEVPSETAVQETALASTL